MLSQSQLETIRGWDMPRLAYEYRQAGHFPTDKHELEVSTAIMDELERRQKLLEVIQMTARERAEKVFAEWEKKGVMPFDETHWMNRDDKEAIIAPIAKAIEEAVEEALYERDQSEWCKDK